MTTCGEPVALYGVAYGDLHEPCAKPKGHEGGHDPSIDVVREAAAAVIRAADAYRAAVNGDGHPDAPHDDTLNRGPVNGILIRSTVDDCALCGAMQYGTEDNLHLAYGDLREALGGERLPWEGQHE